MHMLITGAGGFIGSYLVERCRLLGHHVVGIDRKDLTEWSHGCLTADREICLDVRGIGDLGYSIGQVDWCFHLAADARIQPSFEMPVEYVSNNILSTTAVLDFCKQKGARVVYAGSSTADDDVTKNVYAVTKHTGETLCRTWSHCFGLSTAVARFYNVYGPRQIEDGLFATVIGIWEKQLREGRKLTVTGDGHKRRDFTAVRDIVMGLLAIAERGGHEGQVYALGTGVNYSILDVARMFVPSDDCIEFIPARPGESEVTLADVAVTEQAIGWKAEKQLPDYIRDIRRSVPCPC